MCLSWRGKESQKWGIKLKNEQEEKQSFATVSYKNRIEKPSVCVRWLQCLQTQGEKRKSLGQNVLDLTFSASALTHT